jgi:hypothetical protein
LAWSHEELTQNVTALYQDESTQSQIRATIIGIDYHSLTMKKIRVLDDFNVSLEKYVIYVSIA